MKIFVLNPYPLVYSKKKSIMNVRPRQPLSLAYIASLLLEKDYEVKLIDMAEIDPTILTGAHGSLTPEWVFKKCNTKIIVRGEPEITVLNLVEALSERENIKKIDSGIVNGPGFGLAWIIVEYIQLYFRNKFLRKCVKNLAKILVFPLKYIDNWLIKKANSINLAGGFYYYGKK